MRIFARSDIGCRRRGNEDIISAGNWTSRATRDGRAPAKLESCWALLADGMGGHAHGEIASELAVALLGGMLPSLAGPEDLRQAVAAVHQRLHELMQLHEDLEGMGTTIVGILQLEGTLIGFNVGDSRLYRWREEAFQQLSADDGQGHVLTQCLGGLDRRPIVVHLLEWEPRPGERLLLCSDGLTDMVDERTIAAVLAGACDDPADALVALALAAGGHDNVSVVVADP